VIWLRTGHIRHQIQPFHRWRGARRANQSLGIGVGRADHAAQRAGLADVSHQRARVDTGDPDNAMIAQVFIQRGGRAPAAHARAGGAHYEAR
jgi:hypothetical protein